MSGPGAEATWKTEGASDDSAAGDDGEKVYDGKTEDREAFDELVGWLKGKVEIVPSKIARYVNLFVNAGVGSVKRLAKKIRKTPTFLEELNIAIDDADEISEVLSREGIFEAIRLEKLAAQKAEDAENEAQQHSSSASMLAAASSSLPPAAIITRSRAPSMAPPVVGVETQELRSRQGTLNSVCEGEAPGYLNNPYAYTYVNDHTDDDINHGGTSRARKHTAYNAMRKMSDAKIDLLAQEVAELMAALKSTVDEEDDAMCCEALEFIASVVENSVEKQRAFQRAYAHLGVMSALHAYIGNTEVCERACRCIALLCRCGEDKGTTNYEFCKAFGLSNASDAIVTAVKKHADNEKLVEAACDAVRSMCNLESNKQRFHESGVCEVIAGALANFSADAELCGWICRTLGHLAQSHEGNQETLGENLVTANLVLAVQNHQKNDKVCTEIFWAIRNIAYGHAGNRQRLFTDFGPESIAVAFARHVHVEILAYEATTALVSLVNDEEDEVIGRIANSGAMTFVIRALKKNPESEKLAYRAFQLFYFCASFSNPTYSPMIKRKLTSGDFLEVMSTAFENHAGDSGVAEWGCRLLHILIDPSTQSKMRNAGLCEMVVSAVQRQAISDYICAIGCLVVGDLALEVTNHDRLAAAGACEAACGALRRHDDNVEVVIQACYAIHYLSYTQNNVGWIGANGGCEAVVEALIKHTKGRLDVTQFATRAVGSLAFKDEGNMVRIFDAGGCAAIVVALRTHPRDAEVSEYCCRAIYHLCGDNANVSDLGAKGACGLVVQGLITHMTNSDVAAQACLAISGLAYKTRSDKEHKGNTRKLVARGAVENVVLCIKTYPDKAEVIRAGAMAVTALSRIDANRQKVGESGVVDLLIMGLTQHSAHAECIAKLAQAIEMLSQPIVDSDGSVSDVTKEKFCKAGVAEVLIALLQTHERHSEVVIEVLRALITLATHPISRKFVWSDDACKLYVKVMKIHEKVEDVARWVCNMIYSQAVDNAARVRLGSARACEGVISVLLKHAEKSADVSRYACRAICGLAELDANKRKFKSSDACNAITAALKFHLLDADVAEWACFAIVTTSPNAGNRHKFFLAGAGPAVNKVLTHHIESPLVCTLAFEAVRELSYYVDNRVQLGALGACDAVVKALDLHLDSHEVATHGCRAIAGIAFQHDGNATKLGAAGCCEVILRGLQMHWHESCFIEWAFAAVAVLASKQRKNQDALSDGGIASFIVASLVRHSDSDGLCYQACKAVRCLTFGNDELKSKMALCGVSPIVLACLQKHEASSLVAENAAWVLGNVLAYEGFDDVAKIAAQVPPEGMPLATSHPAPFSSPSPLSSPSPSHDSAPDSPSSKPSPRRASAAFYGSATHWEALVDSLEIHLYKPQVARWVCAAVSTFADRSKTENLRACELVMQALTLHSDALSVCNKVLVCVGALAHSDAKNASSLGKLKACEEVSSILTRSEEEPAIHGCFAAIAGLANVSKANQARFSGAPSLCKDIVQKLFDMFEHPSVARWGCASISALCFRNHDNQSKLGKAASFIADIIEHHIKIKPVVRDAVRAAACLAHNHITNRNRLGSDGCCEWVAKVMLVPALSADPSVMLWAVRVVADLAANNPNNQTKLGLHGACEAVVKGVTTKWASAGDDEAVAKYALWAIGNLVQLSRDAGLVADDTETRSGLLVSRQPIKNTTLLSEAGVEEVVMAALARFENSPQVVRWACRAVNNLAKSQRVRGRLNDLRARWALERMCRQHSHDKVLVEWATIAIDMLINGPTPLPSVSSAAKSDGQGSPRTSFSAVADKLTIGLGYLADSAADKMLGSAEKVCLLSSPHLSSPLLSSPLLSSPLLCLPPVRSTSHPCIPLASHRIAWQSSPPKARSKSFGAGLTSADDADKDKKKTKKTPPKSAVGAAPGMATAKTLTALSNATAKGDAASTPAAKAAKKAVPVDTPRTAFPVDPPTTESSPLASNVAATPSSSAQPLESTVTTPSVDVNSSLDR